MFDGEDFHYSTKAEFYFRLMEKAALLREDDLIADMANFSALLWHYLKEINWAGFYRMVGEELLLGPFQGKPACVRIPRGKGVCGTAIEKRKTLVVADVHLFPGHIACDSASRSEIVVPLLKEGQVLGVLDIDSPFPGRFDFEDKTGLEALCRLLLGFS